MSLVGRSVEVRKHGRSGLGNFECCFARPAYGFKPAADIHLGVGLTTEMPGSRAGSGRQVPLDDRELLIAALDHKPMDRILTDGPANLALEFLQTRHALSVERWLGAKTSIAAARAKSREGAGTCAISGAGAAQCGLHFTGPSLWVGPPVFPRVPCGQDSSWTSRLHSHLCTPPTPPAS